MPTTHISPIRSMATRLAYVTVGNGAERRKHLADGTTRYLKQITDLDDVVGVVDYVKAVIQRFSNRRLEGYEVRVSWSRDELDPNNPDDVNLAVAYGHELCHRLFPGCPAVVTAHGDGDGGCLHVHCDVVNHDVVTEKAIRGNGRDHYHVSKVSDELAREYGMRIVERHRSNSWSLQRQVFEQKIERYTESESGKWSAEHRNCVIRLAIGDVISKALDDERVTDLESFESVLLEDYGCEIRRKEVKRKDGSVAVGFTYAMNIVLGDGKRPRVRRAKASAIAVDFDANHIQSTIDARMVERARRTEAERAGVNLVAAPTVEGETAELPLEAAPSREQQIQELIVSHSLIERVPERDESGHTTAIRLVPHELLFESQDERDAATFTLRVDDLRQVLGRGVEQSSDATFLERHNSLPPVASAGAAGRDFCDDYEAAAERVVGADTTSCFNAKTFVGETLKVMANAAKHVWSRLTAAALDLSRQYGLGFEDKDYRASFSSLVSKVAGRRKRDDEDLQAQRRPERVHVIKDPYKTKQDDAEPAVTPEPPDGSAEQTVEDAVKPDLSILYDVVEYTRKARERERAKKNAQQRKTASRARHRAVARRNSGHSHGHGGLGS